MDEFMPALFYLLFIGLVKLGELTIKYWRQTAREALPPAEKLDRELIAAMHEVDRDVGGPPCAPPRQLREPIHWPAPFDWPDPPTAESGEVYPHGAVPVKREREVAVKVEVSVVSFGMSAAEAHEALTRVFGPPPPPPRPRPTPAPGPGMKRRM